MAESPLMQKILDGFGKWAIVDSPNHHWIHEGQFFAYSRTTSALGASSWIDVEFITPSSSYPIHFKEIYVNNSGGAGQILLYEATTNGSTHTASTTVATPINHNRNSTKTSRMTVRGGAVQALPSYSTVTSTQYTLVYNETFGSTGTAASKEGGLFEPRNEVVLKFNTTYVLRLFNNSAAGWAEIKPFWYEIY